MERERTRAEGAREAFVLAMKTPLVKEHDREQSQSMDPEGLVLPCPARPPSERRPIILLFRQDLRLADNPALDAAVATGRPIIPMYVHEPDVEMGGWPFGGAIKYWMHRSLASLSSDIRTRYASNMLFRNADRRTTAGETGTLAHVQEVARCTHAAGAVWNRVYEPWRWRRDVAMRGALESGGVRCLDLKAVLLFDPLDVDPEFASGEELIYGYGSVGWFRRACKGLEVPHPIAAPTSLVTPAWLSLSARAVAQAETNMTASSPPNQLPPREFFAWADHGLDGLGYASLPRRRTDGALIDWAVGIREAWDMGEEAGQRSLDRFLAEGAEHFESKDRFRADKSWTAQISPYMQVGELSPRTVYHAAARSRGKEGAKTFLRRLAWRDLAFWTLCRFPASAE